LTVAFIMTSKYKTRKSRDYIPKAPGSKVCSPRMTSRKVNITKCLPDSVVKTIKAYGSKSETSNCEGNKELCLIKNSSMSEAEKNKIIQHYFRPKKPDSWKKKRNTWLSSDDINQVMNQYEKEFRHFKFLGVVPVDFSAPDPYSNDNSKCIIQTFCKVDLKDLRSKGKQVIGAIFNLDEHYKDGSHWVSLVILPKGVYYFDSYGFPPPWQISRFMRSMTLQDANLELGSCGRRFQYGNSECGMYSLYFIIRMITGESFKRFCKHSISDKWMLAFRDILFRD